MTVLEDVKNVQCDIATEWKQFRKTFDSAAENRTNGE